MKSKQMQKDLDELSEGLFGRSRTKSKINSTCVTCEGNAISFDDELSRKEYEISGMCQECQDSVFG